MFILHVPLCPAGPALSRNRGSRTSLPMQGIHILLSCMLATWLLAGAGMLGGAPLFPAKMLVLDHMHGLSRWWTLLTDAFVSPSIQLLARNVFFGYMFGRSIQNTDGGAAVWTTWFMSALGELPSLQCHIISVVAVSFQLSGLCRRCR